MPAVVLDHEPVVEQRLRQGYVGWTDAMDAVRFDALAVRLLYFPDRYQVGVFDFEIQLCGGQAAPDGHFVDDAFVAGGQLSGAVQ